MRYCPECRAEHFSRRVASCPDCQVELVKGRLPFKTVAKLLASGVVGAAVTGGVSVVMSNTAPNSGAIVGGFVLGIVGYVILNRRSGGSGPGGGLPDKAKVERHRYSRRDVNVPIDGGGGNVGGGS